uniref:H15 domain-containing protein n=1 Tax=Mola mola TaxID=94237 RepID=A0A3Q4AJQ4_MOLML
NSNCRADATGACQQAPAKRRSSRAKKRSCSVSQLVLQAVSESGERSGVSLPVLHKALAATGYNAQKNKARVRAAIRSLVRKGTLVQSKGCFRMSMKGAKPKSKKRAKRATPKTKKRGAKRPTAAKKSRVTKKRAAAKKSLRKRRSAKRTPVRKAAKPRSKRAARKKKQSPTKRMCLKAPASGGRSSG